MDQQSSEVDFLVFDVECVADGDLISKVRYPKLELTPEAAIAQYRAELVERLGEGRDFIPATFMLPISVAIAKVSSSYELLDLIVLDEPEFRPHVIAKKFWQGWHHYKRPTFVTFNGRGYDLPVLELAAYRYGFSVPAWFNVEARSYEQTRNRYNIDAHIDLLDLFSNYGAMRVNGGLNLLANIIGKPGKTGIDGSQVQDMYDAGKVSEINDYCRCDVLDTYFVFLRSRVMLGKLELVEEQRIVASTKKWLEERVEESTAYAHYLEHWGDWTAPEF
ncbi:MAG: 3'-5' exonuclease [Planctomycetaceae bacterium]|nr:3'-5' exonuclease [Planctomycetaceae bacterium]